MEHHGVRRITRRHAGNLFLGLSAACVLGMIAAIASNWHAMSKTVNSISTWQMIEAMMVLFLPPAAVLALVGLLLRRRRSEQA